DPAHEPKDKPLITCDETGTAKYILGPVELDGSAIDDAQAGINQQNGQLMVAIEFDGEGSDVFADVSQRLYNLTGAQNQFAFVLDGLVISAPSMDAVITNGNPQISGPGIDEESSKTLADQLRFGALPMSFQVV